MNKKPFQAGQWLIESSKKSRADLQVKGSASFDQIFDQESTHKLVQNRLIHPQPPQRSEQSALIHSSSQNFTPSNFLIPGWTGEGLISKSAIELKNHLSKLLKDSQSRFKKNQWSKTQRKNIFNEFQSYATFPSGPKGLSWIEIHEEFRDESFFWNSLKELDLTQNEEYPSPDETPLAEIQPPKHVLNNFIKIFCFRSITLYIFRMRFISALSNRLEIPLLSSSLLNPNAFIQSHFRRGSSTEIKAKSLQSNEYSWYIPSPELTDILHQISAKMSHLTTTEIMKIFSSESSDLIEKSKLEFKDSDYSHSLSHKCFGQFINDLLLFFPHWIKGEKLLPTPDQTRVKPFLERQRTSLKGLYNKKCEVLNTKFAGDNMSAISLSHWLAQESTVSKNNSLTSQNEILCPEFIGRNFKSGKFLKYCHELQYLYFLVQLSSTESESVIKFISHVFREKYDTHHTDDSGQMNFFNQFNKEDSTQEVDETKFHRTVLNLIRMPRKNPHHYLINQILTEGKSLRAHGFLFVFTNQKLFVPSHNERVKQLLSEYHVQANFSFEELKGKGEIGNYLYVLKKRVVPTRSKSSNWEAGKILSEKEPCLSFRINGHLSIFHKFNLIVSALREFMFFKEPHRTPIYQKELAEGFTFEFYQDAILDGKLLSSTTKDSSQITHPLFFRKLTKSSMPLGHFFKIESLGSNLKQERKGIPVDLLGISFDNSRKYPFVLIASFQDPNQVKLELIKYENYFAKKEQYGNAFFQYFGLSPKVPQININLFKEYFETSIGNQVIQLCLNGGPAKIKSKLNSLLVPHFFADTKQLTPYQEEGLNFLFLSAEELLSTHPDNLKLQWENTKRYINQYLTDYTWQVLGQLSYFKAQLISASELIGDHNLPLETQLLNPMIIEKLVSLKTASIFPYNEEIFIEFIQTSPQRLNVPLEEVRISSNPEGSPRLELYSGNQKIIELHGPMISIKFIHFILKSSLNMNIFELINSLQVPSSSEIEGVLGAMSSAQEVVRDLLNQAEQTITQSFIQKIH